MVMDPDPEPRIKASAAELEEISMVPVAVAEMPDPTTPEAIEEIEIVARAAPEAKRTP